jgi:hypothetical protein
MATLLIHVISDFLRDQPPQAGQFGEVFRCAVLENDTTALTNYGCNAAQITVLQTRDRTQILNALSKEIGAVMDELGVGPGITTKYPGGSVRVKQTQLLWSAGNQRNVMVRGDGFDNAVTVDFVPAAGNAVSGTVHATACDKDVWQRLYVTATLPAGTYTVRVTGQGGSQATLPLTIP